jgi:hypothetical protein
VSQENVEIYRRIVEAFNTSDGVPDALLAPDFRIENIVTAVTDKTYYGVAGCAEWLNDLTEAYGEEPRFEIEKIVAERDDFVIARVALAGTGARSGADLRLRWIGAAWFKKGTATRLVGYANRHEALKAVGLEDG